MGSDQTRGARNNNPLNIRRTATEWKGERKTTKDSVFEEFETIEFGYRAAIINMRTLMSRGNNTLAKLINAWAPPHENDTNNYLSYVSTQSGIKATDSISFDKELLFRIIRPMAKIESNLTLTRQTFDNAWNLI